MAKKLSELLADLTAKAKQLEDKFQTSKNDSKEQLQQWQNSAKENVAETKAAFDAKKDSLENEVKSHWGNVKSNWDNGVSKVKADFREAKYNLKAADAEMSAEWAEDDAEMSVYFALDAISDAQEAVIEAVKARAEANSYKSLK